MFVSVAWFPPLASLSAASREEPKINWFPWQRLHTHTTHRRGSRFILKVFLRWSSTLTCGLPPPARLWSFWSRLPPVPDSVLPPATFPSNLWAAGETRRYPPSSHSSLTSPTELEKTRNRRNTGEIKWNEAFSEAQSFKIMKYWYRFNGKVKTGNHFFTQEHVGFFLL